MLHIPDQPSMLPANSLMNGFGNFTGGGVTSGETGITPDRNPFGMERLLMNRNANISIESRNELFSPYMSRRSNIQVPTPLRHNNSSIMGNIGTYLPSFGGTGTGTGGSAQFGGAS